MRLTDRRQQGQAEHRAHSAEELKSQLWRVNWKAEGYPYCGVYVISPDNRWPCKIGISQNPSKRLVGLQTASWRPLDIFGYRYCANPRDARDVEQKVHRILSDGNLALNGEWFDIRPEKAVDTVDFAAELLGIEIRSEIPNQDIETSIRNHSGWVEHQAFLRACNEKKWLGDLDSDI